MLRRCNSFRCRADIASGADSELSSEARAAKGRRDRPMCRRIDFSLAQPRIVRGAPKVAAADGPATRGTPETHHGVGFPTHAVAASRVSQGLMLRRSPW